MFTTIKPSSNSTRSLCRTKQQQQSFVFHGLVHQNVSSSCSHRTAKTTVVRAASGTESKTDKQPIENLNRDYCDDFVCTSSPAIEQTVRSLARDLTRFRYTSSLFQKECKYQVTALVSYRCILRSVPQKRILAAHLVGKIAYMSYYKMHGSGCLPLLLWNREACPPDLGQG